MCVFLIFEFWVIWDQMSKCPKWAHHHPISAISWCLDMILHVLWDTQQKSGKKSKTNRKICALRQSLFCCLILESSKLTHCLDDRTIYIFLTWSYTFCDVGVLSRTTTCCVGFPEKFWQKIWDKSKKIMHWSIHSSEVKCRNLQYRHIIYISTCFMTFFNMIMHVLRFESFQSDHKLLCRICRKVLAKKSETNRKIYARRHPLIPGQMSKSSKWTDYSPICTIFIVFRCCNVGFMIFEFWLQPRSSV